MPKMIPQFLPNQLFSFTGALGLGNSTLFASMLTLFGIDGFWAKGITGGC